MTPLRFLAVLHGLQKLWCFCRRTGEDLEISVCYGSFERSLWPEALLTFVSAFSASQEAKVKALLLELVVALLMENYVFVSSESGVLLR